MTCKTCKHLDVPLDSLGRRVVRQRTYRCLVPWPSPPHVADCFSYSNPTRRYMAGDDGANCPAHEPITKARAAK
jgi:hypothetical protein